MQSHGVRALPGLRGSFDFVGLNYYTRERVAFDRRSPSTLFGRLFTPANVPQSDAGSTGRSFGEIYAEGLYRALRRVARLGRPIYITETGLPDDDDDQRPGFILSHMRAVHRALRDGIDVRGVFLWTLVDNFEWAEGWGLRFGLYALILMSNTGLRAVNELEQLPRFEYAATFGSQAVRNVLFNIQPGMTEYEAVELMQLNGLPLSCHLMLSAGARARMGLPSPSSRRIAFGDPVTTAVGLWGGLNSRAGFLVASAAELPSGIQDYAVRFPL